MSNYFNYHSIARQLIKNGKLQGFYYTERHNSISPALVLLFDSPIHPVMPIRREHWAEYEKLLKSEQN